MINSYNKATAIYFVAGTFTLLACATTFYYLGFLPLSKFLHITIMSSSVLSVLVIILSYQVINMDKKMKASLIIKEKQVLKNMITDLSQKITQLEREKGILSEKKDFLKQELKDKVDFVNVLCEMIENLEKEKDMLATQKSELYYQTFSLDKELQEKEDSFVKNTKLIAKLNKEISNYKEEKETWCKEKRKLLNKTQDLECKIKHLYDENSALEEKIFSINSELLQKKQKLDDAEKQLVNVNVEINNSSCELRKIHEENDARYKKHRNELLCEIRKIQEELDEVKEHKVHQMEDFKQKITTFLINAVGEFMNHQMAGSYSEEEVSEVVHMIESHLTEKASTYSPSEGSNSPTNDMEEISFTQEFPTLPVLFEKRG